MQSRAGSGWRRATALLLWTVPAAVFALVLARLSVAVQPTFSPVVLFPMLLGVALGLFVVSIRALAEARGTRSAVLGAVLLSVFLAGAEHWFFYRAYVQQREEFRQGPHGPAFAFVQEEAQPLDFGAFLAVQAKGPRPWLWGLHAACIVAGAVGVVVVRQRATAIVLEI